MGIVKDEKGRLKVTKSAKKCNQSRATPVWVSRRPKTDTMNGSPTVYHVILFHQNEFLCRNHTRRLQSVQVYIACEIGGIENHTVCAGVLHTVHKLR